MSLTVSRRTLLRAGGTAAAAIALPAHIGRAEGAAKTLKISHQFPGGTLEAGDFRDRLVRIFAQKVEAATNGALKFEIYANSSLMKTNAQYSALRKGALDISLYPFPYAGGEVHSCNLGLMPCLVTNYDQAAKWKPSKLGAAITKIQEEKGIKIISWVWQAGGIASRSKTVLVPDDVKGLKIRGGSREMDLMFTQAGGAVSTMPSNEIYIGMQTGSLDAAVTSSTSLISFRLEELSKSLTANKGRSFWFMLEPLLMSKAIFDALPADQQKAIMAVGAEMETFGFTEAKRDDEQVAKVYAAKGAEVVSLTDEHIAAWRKLAEASAWADYAAKSTEAAELLAMAKAIS
jgi:TRAP-type transport system periplasmic protein